MQCRIDNNRMKQEKDNNMATTRKSPTIIITMLSAILMTACMQDTTSFDYTVAYYKQRGDYQKVLAAEFLRDNAQWHYGISRHLSRSPKMSFQQFLSRQEVNKDSVFQHYLDSCNIYIEESDTIWDSDIITKDFIQENIDLAFDSWKQPWAKDVSFDDFCHYILPYRNGDEELSQWRQFFKNRYESSIIDSVANPSSLPQVVDYLMRCIRRDVEYGGSMGLFCSDMLTPKDMLQLHWMECLGCAHFTTLAMRACGVPCATIKINWRFTDIPHYSALFPESGSNERAFRLTVGDTLIYMGEPKDSMASYSTWMFSYESNPNLVELSRDTEANSNYWFPVTRQDITSIISKTYDISMPVTEDMKRHSHVYLCRFNQWHWTPIRDGRVVNDSVCFNGTTIRQWYRLGVMDGDSIRTFGHPFTVIGPQLPDSLKYKVKDTYSIKEYNSTGDTVLYKMVYGCKPDEKRLTRDITTYYWDENDNWRSVRQDAVLWGLNEKTGEYKVFDESMRGVFKPVFHLLKVRLPKWTVFYDNETPRPLGFICEDSVSNEGYFMQF